jgi:hypothetical protein
MGNPAGVKRDFEALERRRFEAFRLLKQGLSEAQVAWHDLSHSGKPWRPRVASTTKSGLCFSICSKLAFTGLPRALTFVTRIATFS